MHAENKDEAIEEKATIPVKGYTDAYDLIHDFWFYGFSVSLSFKFLLSVSGMF